MVCSAAVNSRVPVFGADLQNSFSWAEKPAALLVPNFVMGGSLRGWLPSEELILSFFPE